MQRQNIVILQKPLEIDDLFQAHYEPWGSLKKACDAHGWKYNTLAKKKFPFTHDGWAFHKARFNEMV